MSRQRDTRVELKNNSIMRCEVSKMKITYIKINV